MEFIYPFEKLEIWQLSVDFATDIYKLTDNFPSEEKFGVISQMRRAANSVGANIVEGTSRRSVKEKSRFIEISYSSLMEVIHFLHISQKLGYISELEFKSIKDDIFKLSNKINAFRRNIK